VEGVAETIARILRRIFSTALLAKDTADADAEMQIYNFYSVPQTTGKPQTQSAGRFLIQLPETLHSTGNPTLYRKPYTAETK
jgi:hypothetical protein